MAEEEEKFQEDGTPQEQVAEVQYIDDTPLGWVQTPVYYEDCVELDTFGDPCGHRNGLYYDVIENGADGYEAVTMKSTNVLLRRAALDSVGGIQYGSFTEGELTGLRMQNLGWNSCYFRKDWSGDMTDESARFPLVLGDIPGSVSQTMINKKRAAQGSCEIFMRVPLTHGLIDEKWKEEYDKERPTQPPKKGKQAKVYFMRSVIFFNAFYYPIASMVWILYTVLVTYMLFDNQAGSLVFHLNTWLTKYAYLPYILICGIMNVAAMRPVASMDSVKGKETCFSMAWPNLFGFLSALWVRISCMQSYKKKWAGHKKVQTQGSLFQLPNVITFIVLIVGLVYSLTSFFTNGFHSPWEYFPQICLGMYMASSLFPVVRLTIQEYFGWAPESLQDRGGMSSTIVLAALAAWASLWKAMYVRDQGMIMF